MLNLFFWQTLEHLQKRPFIKKYKEVVLGLARSPKTSSNHAERSNEQHNREIGKAKREFIYFVMIRSWIPQ
jgi:hypothetical protein